MSFFVNLQVALKNFNLGFRNNGNYKINVKQVYIKSQYNNFSYELGHIKDASISSIAISNKKYKIEFSNKFGSNNLASLFSYKIEF